MEKAGLFCCLNGLKNLPKVRFQSPFNPIGQSNKGFLTGQLWRILKFVLHGAGPRTTFFFCFVFLRRPHNLKAWNRLGLNKRFSIVGDAGLHVRTLRVDELNLKNNLESVDLSWLYTNCNLLTHETRNS